MTRAVVIGAGAGGLAASLTLAAAGIHTTVLEAAPHPGGKMRQLDVAGQAIDAGPTVFTMPWVFRELFAKAHVCFDDAVNAEQASVLARHAWCQGGSLDLYADRNQSAAAIAQFASPRDADGYRALCRRAEDIHNTLRDSFMAAQQPSVLELVRRIGLRQLPALWRTAPQRTLWSALGDYFEDPRLRQLYARYATYVGSSPTLCPATLMLIAHVEQEGVWLLHGGMRALADAMMRAAVSVGVQFEFDRAVTAIRTSNTGKVAGVSVDDLHYPADLVVFNGDHAALAGGKLGSAVAGAVPKVAPAARGLSALTWCLSAQTNGFALDYHNVFFDDHYKAEFATIFQHRDVPANPTVYVCAQDRVGGHRPTGPERLLMLINAPADGDRDPWPEDREHQMQERALSILERCGLTLSFTASDCKATNPADFNALFPASGGSLYGRASHGMMASFNRPGARCKIPGLYLAGGTVHPGPGVPMATLSGRLAAEAALSDLDAV